MTPVIHVQNLSKTFGGVPAVSDVSFDLGPGEILGLLGPNGAGKTTIFQMLLGVLTPSGGRVEYFGLEFGEHRREILERINFSSTYTNLPWNLRVSDNLSFLSRLYRLKNRTARVAEIAEAFRLRELWNKPVVALSAGELTRLNLAKAFLNEPEIVLLDEPTASLDPESARFVRTYILERRRSSGLSVVFTSHNMNEIEAVCDRVVFLNRGKIVASDAPRKLAATLDKCSLSFIVDTETEQIVRSLASERDMPVDFNGHEVTVGLRDEQIALFLASLSQRGIPVPGLTVNRATLEDYFISQAEGVGK